MFVCYGCNLYARNEWYAMPSPNCFLCFATDRELCFVSYGLC